MIGLKASEIAEIVGGELHGDDCLVTAAPEISSLKSTPGSIFLAIKGENVDGHDYITDAFAKGAVLAFTSRVSSERCIVIADVVNAISLLASHVRNSLSELTVIGITGSQGKTTTKELLSHVLAGHGETIAPTGNYNNELGVPLTLLRCTESTKFAVIEMGARHMGDIASLCEIAKPNIGVVLRVAAAHLGEFGSLEKIAQTKSEMIEGLKGKGVAVLGTYDSYTPKMSAKHAGLVITFGETSENPIRATEIELREGCAHFDLVTPAGRSPVALRLVGLHQVANALAAAAVAHVLGFSTDEIANSLSLADSQAKWRMEIHQLPELTLINDAYNASPDSMEAALRTLAYFSQERGGESWAFLGKMAELGESSSQEHEKIGTLASEIGIDHLIAIASPEFAGAVAESVGGETGMSIHLCSDKSEALKLIEFINPGDVVLCKGSRSAGLEEVADEVINRWKLRMENQ
ncbi:MAG: UDP-N-acetylmuramoyl-tripeptide--D-alanyl-D-alanine ligase [Actinobacteria bacterium]|uniref:UDP-MurNAc-pentapeptide synthetase n=1 Tax=freshwater metagenome TaxID=449393 RepID=A0A6J6BMA0_9ZZZZ|nr:UDP-N-acetylmuramoyl-tripeptide--D-alanyl-D-alanine ligase [Actinomycetota bacterium]